MEQKQYEFKYQGHELVGPVLLTAEDRLDAKRQLRQMGFKDDPHFVKGDLTEVKNY